MLRQVHPPSFHTTPVPSKRGSMGRADSLTHCSYQEAFKGTLIYSHPSAAQPLGLPVKFWLWGWTKTDGNAICPCQGAVLLYRTEGVMKSGSPGQKAAEGTLRAVQSTGPTWERQSHGGPSIIWEVGLAWERGAGLRLRTKQRRGRPVGAGVPGRPKGGHGVCLLHSFPAIIERGDQVAKTKSLFSVPSFQAAKRPMFSAELINY